MNLEQRVYKKLLDVPKGQITTYGELAKAGRSSMRVFPLDQVEKMYTEHQKYLEELLKDL